MGNYEGDVGEFLANHQQPAVSPDVPRPLQNTGETQLDGLKGLKVLPPTFYGCSSINGGEEVAKPTAATQLFQRLPMTTAAS